jgi:hypothetical protein
MKNLFKYTLTAFIAVALLSCEKDYDGIAPAEEASEVKKITDPAEQQRIRKAIDRLPRLAVYSEHIDKYILLDFNETKNGFNFASPDAGFAFTSPSGSVEFVQGPDGTFYQVATVEGPAAGGGGGGGGTVSAGDIDLDCEVVLCFSSGDDFFGLDLFQTGIDQSFGISGAIGIGGDFSGLMEMSEDEIAESDFSDFFTGFAAFMVFDGTADGSYEVLDFSMAEGEEDESALSSFAVAFFFSFQDEGGIFFSSDGELNFDGGSVGFEGTYLGITGFFFGSESPEEEFVEVDGSGELFCG